MPAQVGIQIENKNRRPLSQNKTRRFFYALGLGEGNVYFYFLSEKQIVALLE